MVKDYKLQLLCWCASILSHGDCLVKRWRWSEARWNVHIVLSVRK